LRNAIEEDYTPPKIRERKRSQKVAQSTIPEPTPLPTPDSEPLLEEDHQEIWKQILDRVRQSLPYGVDPGRLNGTRLLRLSGTAAVIGVPNQGNSLHLERKPYQQISEAVKQVIGKQFDLQFLCT
jgi:hypothetical protein